MGEQNKSTDRRDADLRDSDLAIDQRPVPSQAEGDLATVEDDLREKDQDKSKTASSGGKG